MKRWKQWIALLLLAAFALTSCGGGNSNAIPVVLTESDNIRILSENPVTVKSGGEAIFQIEVTPGFSVRPSEAYTYADGTLTVKNVLFPTTIVVGLDFDVEAWANIDPSQIPTDQEFSFACAPDDNTYGETQSSHENGTLAGASQISITAKAKEDGRFVCWSFGGTLASGGTPISYDEELSFYLSMNTEIYANFAAKESATLIYDANGGQTENGGRYIRQDAPTDFYFYPHALANQGQMTRDGYVLYTYNTEPDGSGIDYTFGANVVTPESGTLVLYAQWVYADPTQFIYRIEKDGVHIVGCDSFDEWVVVPEEIEGQPVTTINSRAFEELPDMTTLVLNRNIEWIDEGAVYNCPSFTTLYLCDNIRRIPDNFAVMSPEFQTVHLGAVLDPTRMNQRGGTFHIKFQRLLKAQAEGKNAVIILSGSSSEYGFNSEVFEQEMNYEYYPVNLGTTAQISILFMLEAIKDFVDEGDIIIQAPETSESQLGGNEVVSNYWGCYEGVPELLSHVDIRNYTKLFSTLTTFNETRYKMDSTPYSEHNEEINRYGDNQTIRENPSPDYASGKDKFLSPENLTEKNAERLNWAYADIEDTGAKVYLSFCPINVNCFSEEMKESSAQYAYQKRFETLLDIPVISDLSDYVMEGKYFYNSDYHPSNEGSEVRTKQLVADLKAQLAKEAKKN